MKIVDSRKNLIPRCISFSEIPIGTIFYGEILETGIYLKAYNVIINLRDPSKTWYDCPGLHIVNYVPLPNTKLIIED